MEKVIPADAALLRECATDDERTWSDRERPDLGLVVDDYLAVRAARLRALAALLDKMPVVAEKAWQAYQVAGNVVMLKKDDGERLLDLTSQVAEVLHEFTP